MTEDKPDHDEQLEYRHALEDLYLWLHNNDPTSCPCQQCKHQRATINRIKEIHEDGPFRDWGERRRARLTRDSRGT